MLEHANELIDILEAKGIKPAPEDEQDGDGWEGVDADSDGDFKMS